jgi:hypothetical protein
MNHTTKNPLVRQTQTSLFKSFTEKKLTGLMASICIIYGSHFPTIENNIQMVSIIAIGNLPQMAVMVFQNEALNSAYNFQV